MKKPPPLGFITCIQYPRTELKTDGVDGREKINFNKIFIKNGRKISCKLRYFLDFITQSLTVQW